jgi:hypothetical protein
MSMALGAISVSSVDLLSLLDNPLECEARKKTVRALSTSSG